MDQIMEIVEMYNMEIMMVLLIAFFLLIILYLVTAVRISKLKSRYEALTRGSDGINIEEILSEHGHEIDQLKDETSRLEEELDRLGIKLDFAIQKIGFVKYNAFADMGSELSFSIAFLDDHHNGFVLSSIHSRENSICYAKPIKNGKSTYPLSAEEIQAIDRAKREAEYMGNY